MDDINKAELKGTVTQIFKAQTVTNGSFLLSFQLATEKKWKGKTFTKKHNINVWGDNGAGCSDMVAGDRVHVIGEFGTEKYTKKNGEEGWKTVVVGKTIELIRGQRQPEFTGQPSVPDELPNFAPGNEIPF